jgi:hypothetical protein
MAQKTRVSPWLRGTLYVVAVLCLPTFLIQVLRPDALDPKAHRPTVQTVKFGVLLKTGIWFEWLRRNDAAIAKFQEAERYTEQLTDTKYESLQKARERLAETYLEVGRASDAEQVYARIVQSSMETGDALRLKNNYGEAVFKYQDAERFSQKLATTRLPSLCLAQRSLSGSLLALQRNAELEPVYTRMLSTLQEMGDPYDIELGNTYRMIAMARSALNNWTGAEESLLQAADAYDQIIFHFGRTDDSRVLNAKEQKDFTGWYRAVCYYNEQKYDLALSTAEDAFEVLSRREGARSVPLGVYTAGLQAAIALGNREQTRVWQLRMSNLQNPARIPDNSAGSESEQIP